ncbi:MAG: type III-B CRISPR module RAMP protein Cmr6 [Candidatus Marinimicrobia bacterium]|nr:type III-B CRISPR module RAMP protein Cmr6 [Candidatus Neomarinimicrobiota bacterium]
MNIRTERPYQDYKFYNCNDTSKILYSLIYKKSKYEYNKRKQKEEKKDWWYESHENFEKNIGLLFSRLIPESCISGEEKENKDKYLEFIIKEFEKVKNSIIPEIIVRQKIYIKDLKRSGYESKDFVLLCPWRLIVGLGSSHPQETSMTFHHIYGIPYIPGSAVKGVTRHWVILKFYEEIGLTDLKQINCLEKILETADLENKDDKLSEKDFKEKFKTRDSNGNHIEPDSKLYDFLRKKQYRIKEFQNIFGTQSHKGKIIFFDSYPIDTINLKIDIMNPHYPEYYKGIKHPADWQTPVPIKFLTVENTKFQFYLASGESNLLQEAEMYLKEAIKEYGVGAKTSLGYGIFREE